MSWLNYEFEKVKVKNLVIEGHKGQSYGDMDYYWHLCWVEEKVRFLNDLRDDLPNKLVELSWCHDILEDNPDFYNEKVKPLLPQDMHESVVAISKQKGETRNEYLKRCMENSYAHKVKIADTMSNLEMSVKCKDSRRIKKYTRQLEKLTNDWTN